MNDDTEKTEAAGAPHEDYADRIEGRKLRYLGRADNAARLAANLRVSANHMADTIPFGQPILIGHHSEGRDRRFRQRMHDKGMKSVEQDRKAAHYQQRAHSVGRGGISSDDPEATEKLRQKVKTAREAQELMKSVNRVVRSKVKTDEQKVAEIVAKGLPEKGARKLLEGDFCGRVGYPDYVLKNNLANIKRMEARIAEIERERSTPAQMEAAVFEGVGGPSEPGYQLRSGKITVPGTRFQGPQFTFSTSKLVEAIEVGQGDLFGSPIAAAGHH